MKIKAIFLTFFLCFCGCRQYGNISNENLELTQNISGLYMFEAEKGQTKWTLQSEKARVFENNSKAELINPSVSLQEHGKIVSKIKSQKGLLDIPNKTIVLTGRVKARSVKENIFLTCEKLNYSTEKRKFYTDGYVKIKQTSAVVTGYGFSANEDLSKIIIHNQKTKLLQK